MSDTKPKTAIATPDAKALEKRRQYTEAAMSLDTLVKDRFEEIQAAQSEFSKALAVGRAYFDIKAALVSQMDFVVALAGQANGFKTDKQYDPDTIKRCAVDALIAGCSLTGNEFNIIGGNMYVAQNGWKGKLKKLPGFAFADVPEFDLPVATNGTATVKCRQKYTLNGEPQSYDFTAYVRLNSASSIDNTLGKAKAKLWHALFEKITGESWADAGDYDDDKRMLLPKTQSPLSLKSVTADSAAYGQLFPADAEHEAAMARDEQARQYKATV